MNFRSTFILLLSLLFLLGACSDNSELTPEPTPDPELELTSFRMLTSGDDENLPLSYDNQEWTYQSDGKVDKMRYLSFNQWTEKIDYSNNQIKVIGTYVTNATIYDTLRISLDQGRVSSLTHTTKTVWPESKEERFNISTWNYHYNAEGYLVRISDPLNEQGEQDILRLTISNGNVIKAERMIYSYWDGKLIETEKYSYSYDEKPYIPKSDWAPITPRYLATPLLIFVLLEGRLGKDNKNNIVHTDRISDRKLADIYYSYLNYTPVLDEQNRLKEIQHTGQFLIIDIKGTTTKDFTKAKTLFGYTPKNK